MYGYPAAKELELRTPAASGGDGSGVGGAGGLLRYRSAPSAFLGEVCEDLLPTRSSSPETMMARFLNHEKPLPPPFSMGVAHPPERGERREEDGGGTAGFAPAHHPAQLFYGASSLVRQTSSPDGLFTDNGMARRIGSGGGAAASGRLGSRLSFSSRQGSFMSQIPEMDLSSNIGSSSPETDENDGAATEGRCYIPGFPVGSWDDPHLAGDSFSGVKRARGGGDPDGKIINGISHQESQFGLLKTSSDMAAMEKLLHFQDAVPCKIRAKRGCATHPRSIAERVRRTRISERMRKLQELVPNMDKQTNTADMLELAVEYIKDLQKQTKALSDDRASCTCSSRKQSFC